MSRRKGSAKAGGEQPQVYQPRVECSLEALRHGLIGSQTIVHFLLAEEGLDAPC